MPYLISSAIEQATRHGWGLKEFEKEEIPYLFSTGPGTYSNLALTGSGLYEKYGRHQAKMEYIVWPLNMMV